MPSYVDIDGVPASADPRLLTTLLRDSTASTGWSSPTTTRSPSSRCSTRSRPARARRRCSRSPPALTSNCRAPAASATAARPGRRRRGAGEVIDRAVTRVLWQKLDLGLLDPDWSRGRTAGGGQLAQAPDLDPPAQRDIARRLAEESVILLTNAARFRRPGAAAGGGPRVAVVGPLADDPLAFFGCYSMPRHLGHMRRFDGSAAGRRRGRHPARRAAGRGRQRDRARARLRRPQRRCPGSPRRSAALVRLT